MAKHIFKHSIFHSVKEAKCFTCCSKEEQCSNCWGWQNTVGWGLMKRVSDFDKFWLSLFRHFKNLPWLALISVLGTTLSQFWISFQETGTVITFPSDLKAGILQNQLINRQLRTPWMYHTLSYYSLESASSGNGAEQHWHETENTDLLWYWICSVQIAFSDWWMHSASQCCHYKLMGMPVNAKTLCALPLIT